MLNLSKIRDRVYCLRVDNTYELAMTCLRYSEMTECPNNRFHKPFTIVEYMSWYSRVNDGEFSYPTDWGGWNMPVNNIKKVHDAGITDPNHYDALMLGIHGFITSDCQEPAYLICLPTDSDVSLDHELTHAMYYIDDVYRAKVADIYAKTSALLMQQLRRALIAGGYSYLVVDDEIQAYITTGERFFEKIKNDESFDVLRERLKTLHNKHFTSFMQSVSSK